MLTLVRELRAGGASATTVITGLLAPAQGRVGELWQTEVWNVAQEHAATAIVDAALAEIELGTSHLPLHGSVVVTCAEGEWHALPARMFAEQLRELGWSVTFLGASTPSGDLARFLEPMAPAGVAVSCSIAAYLPGAERTVEAAHACGLPAVVGGAAFGPDGRRALTIGADAWAASPTEAAATLRTWAAERPTLRVATSNRAALRLAAIRDEVLEAAMIAAPALRAAPDDLETVLAFTEAAVLVRDPSVLTEVVPWLELIATSRRRPADTVRTMIEALAGVVPVEHAEARALLEAATR